MSTTRKKRGRPPMFESPEAMESKIEDYINMCLDQGRPMTVVGMARYLGFASYRSFQDYSRRNHRCAEYAHILKRAKLRIEQDLSERLVAGRGPVNGVIFCLKVNFGWREARNINLKSAGQGQRGQAGRTTSKVGGVHEVGSVDDWCRWYDQVMSG